MTPSNTILVTGASGQLGRELHACTNLPDTGGWTTGWLPNNTHYIFASRQDLDITDRAAVEQFFDEKSVTHCVNCAAYTAVDKAESESEAAERINALGPQQLAEVAAERDATLIHVSTDFVFDGKGVEENGVRRPYLETDAVNPIGAYGASKAEGELRVLASPGKTFVVRTSWLYSSFGGNFVKTMLRLGEERDELGVVADQKGAPTYARDLAKAIMVLLGGDWESTDYGVYHFSNKVAGPEGVSWCEFAGKIMELSGTECRIKPITTNDYPTPAKRPEYSLLDSRKIEALTGLSIPNWEDSLGECLNLLKI